MLPKHVPSPYSMGVFFAKSVLIFMNSSALIPACLSAPCSAQGFTGRQQKASALRSPPPQICLGALYQPVIDEREVTSKTSSSMIRGFFRTARATDTISAPREHISFAVSKSVIELLPILNRFVEFLIRLITPTPTPSG